jgi:hypothetical protein
MEGRIKRVKRKRNREENEDCMKENQYEGKMIERKRFSQGERGESKTVKEEWEREEDVGKYK